MNLSLIWAQARSGVIGDGGTIPWHVPEDQINFRNLTRGGTVIMGRATWDSLPARFRPLPDRRNVVLTRDPSWSAAGATAVHSVPQALEIARAAENPWIIGGGAVYSAFLPVATSLVVTEIDLDVDGDTMAPRIGPEWSPVPSGEACGVTEAPARPWETSRTGLQYRILTYLR